MASVVFVHPDGREETLDVAPGKTIMQAATAAGIDGIVAECGGSAMCATCHVYVDMEWMPRLPKLSEVEDAMLDSTACERTEESRLSCQIVMADDLDGLRLRLPESQI
jgi:2Fe-2S ferredoxin